MTFAGVGWGFGQFKVGHALDWEKRYNRRMGTSDVTLMFYEAEARSGDTILVSDGRSRIASGRGMFRLCGVRFRVEGHA